jgi:hypothetical protein
MMIILAFDDLVQSHIRLLVCHIEPRGEMIMIVMIFYIVLFGCDADKEEVSAWVEDSCGGCVLDKELTVLRLIPTESCVAYPSQYGSNKALLPGYCSGYLGVIL